MGLNPVTMSETQGQNGEREPRSAGASNSTGSAGRTVIVSGNNKPMKPPKRGGVMKQIWNDISDIWKSPSTETTSS